VVLHIFAGRRIGLYGKRDKPDQSHRLSASKKLVVLGEKDTYEPLCRECYQKALAEDNEQN
jgi:thymidine kinase